MKLLSKLVVAGLLGTASVSANAGMASVGGVTWDTSVVTDFNASYNFQQWFVDANGDWVPASQVQTGDKLIGVGEFYEINNSNAFMCGGCELTLSFSGLTVIVDEINETFEDTPSASAMAQVGARLDELEALGYRNIDTVIDFSTGAITVTADRNGFDPTGSEFVIYTDRELNEMSGETNFDELELATTQTVSEALAEIDQARDGDVWISGTLGTTALTSGSLFDSGAIEFYISFDDDTDMAYNNFVQDIFVDPVTNMFMDAFGSGEASIDNQDAISVSDDQGNVVFATFSGSGTINADSISEPTTIAMMGLTLLGLGVARRRRNTAK